MAELRVLVVAEDVWVRSGLSALLTPFETLRVVGQSTPALLSDEVDLYQADMVLWDVGWTLPVPLPELPSVPVLALISTSDHAPDLFNALSALPAYGILFRETAPTALVSALHSLEVGLIVFSPRLSDRLFSAPSPLIEPLTTREREVVSAVAQGLTNKAIAQRLGITEHTVKFHLNAVMTKLNAQSRTDAVVKATRAGFVTL